MGETSLSPSQTRGQLFYDARGAALDWRDEQGNAIPVWQRLSEREQRAYEVGAKVVAGDAQREMLRKPSESTGRR
jgi:hypothetical protein